jgi:phosphoesterase RecJ-like protein
VEKYWAPENFTPSFVLSVDTASEGVFPVNGKTYLDRVSLCIDHHPSNSGYAENCCLDTEKASCGEIIYELLLELNGGIDAEAAASLYVAVSTDTGCFAFANTTANTHRVAAALIDAGAPAGELNRELFRKKAKSRLLLEAMITSGLEFYFDGAVAISTITADMMENAGASENEMDDVAAIPGAIEEVVVGITIREMSGPADCKVSVRTTPLVNANELSARFGGGGHAMAAGFTIKATTEQTKRGLLEALGDIFPLKI